MKPVPEFTIGPAQCRAVATLLREPERRVRRILSRNRRFLAWLEELRNQPRSAAQLARHAAGIVIPQATQFCALADNDPRSRIIACFHYGDFVYGLNSLMCLEPPQRHRLLLSQRRASAAYFANMRRAFGARVVGPEEQLLVSETSPARLLTRLRQSSTSLVTFCDLPVGAGARIGVRLLQRRASLPRGAATLAVLAGAPLLPVICSRLDGVTRVDIGRQIEPVPRLDESRSQLIARLSQSLAEIIECYLLNAPEYWRYVAVLPAFFFDANGDARAAAISGDGDTGVGSAKPGAAFPMRQLERLARRGDWQ